MWYQVAKLLTFCETPQWIGTTENINGVSMNKMFWWANPSQVFHRKEKSFRVQRGGSLKVVFVGWIKQLLSELKDHGQHDSLQNTLSFTLTGKRGDKTLMQLFSPKVRLTVTAWCLRHWFKSQNAAVDIMTLLILGYTLVKWVLTTQRQQFCPVVVLLLVQNVHRNFEFHWSSWKWTVPKCFLYLCSCFCHSWNRSLPAVF